MESGDNQALRAHVAAGRAPPLIKGAAGQCMFVLLFAHFFHYFISFRPPPTHPRSRLCATFFYNSLPFLSVAPFSEYGPGASQVSGTTVRRRVASARRAVIIITIFI